VHDVEESGRREQQSGVEGSGHRQQQSGVEGSGHRQGSRDLLGRPVTAWWR